MKLTSKTEIKTAPSMNYAPIEPGRYPACIAEISTTESLSKFKELRNPERPSDGKWTYINITPTIELQNDAGTVMDRGRYTVGIVNKAGELIRPQEDGKDPLWGGSGGARSLIEALGGIVDKQLSFDPDTIKNQMVQAHVSLALYRSVSKTNLDTEKLMAAMKVKRLTVDAVKAYVAELNEEISDEDDHWRIKNVVNSFSAVSEAEADDNGWYHEAGKTWLRKPTAGGKTKRTL